MYSTSILLSCLEWEEVQTRYIASAVIVNRGNPIVMLPILRSFPGCPILLSAGSSVKTDDAPGRRHDLSGPAGIDVRCLVDLEG